MEATTWPAAAYAQTNDVVGGTTDVVIIASGNHERKDMQETNALAQTGSADPLSVSILATICTAICAGIEWTLRK